MAKMKTVTRRWNHLEQLKTLATVLADAIDNCEDGQHLPQLTKQYRETIREIDEILGTEQEEDEIGAILSSREADGKSDTIR